MKLALMEKKPRNNRNYEKYISLAKPIFVAIHGASIANLKPWSNEKQSTRFELLVTIYIN